VYRVEVGASCPRTSVKATYECCRRTGSSGKVGCRDRCRDGVLSDMKLLRRLVFDVRDAVDRVALLLAENGSLSRHDGWRKLLNEDFGQSRFVEVIDDNGFKRLVKAIKDTRKGFLYIASFIRVQIPSAKFPFLRAYRISSWPSDAAERSEV
jgi:hypothetical protein